MVRKVEASRGVTEAIVGAQPDEKGPVSANGVRGINKIQDDPYKSNWAVPGSGSDDARLNGDMDGSLEPFNMYDGDDLDLDVEQMMEQSFDEAQSVAGMSRANWVDLGRRCYTTGVDYYRQGFQSQHINNAHLFKGRHEPGSKYYDPVYRNRSRTFRPLTRMASRSWEADIATALFMNDDYMHITARNSSDPQATIGAAVIKEIVNARLDKNWYATCIGAAQDSFINGPVIGKVFWWHEQAVREDMAAGIDENGDLYLETVREMVTVKDEPYIDLILPENLAIDPTAKWNDIVGTAKYFVHRKAMSVDDVRVRMESGEWNLMDEGSILSCRWSDADDAVKMAKQGEGKPDPGDNDSADRAYEQVMINEVFVRRMGIWYVYHMMGTQWLLEDPVELKERYAYNRLPFVIGTAMIESHVISPDSKAAIGAESQRLVNEISNQRVDNVRLALNKRWIARRGSNIDVAALSRSSPGSVVYTSDPEGDIKSMDIPDVTQSSYEETQRVTMEMNELQGTFSGQAVANNREISETVGGMKLLSNAATKVNDFDIRTFVYTWVRPVLELYMLCIQYYENDETILQIAAQNSAHFERLTLEDLTDEVMVKPLDLQVDVGLGATDPVQRVNTLMFGVQSVAALPGMAEKMDAKAVGSAIFATLGQGDGSKFFPALAKNYVEQAPAQPPVDPLVLAAQEEAKGRIEEANINAQRQIAIEQMRLQQDRELKLLQMALDAELQGKKNQIDVLKSLLENDVRLKVAASQDKTRRDTVALQQGSNISKTAMQQAATIAQQQTPTQQELGNDIQSNT